MDKIVNFQLSLFGSFINIQPNQEITMRLIANLVDENMVPGTVNVSSVDPVNKKIDTETRLQMVSHDQSWKIVFLQERIDVTYDYIGGDIYYKSLDDIFKKGTQLVEKTFRTFADTTGVRLAANARVVFSAMSQEEENAFIRRFSSPISLFNNDNMEEWNLHYNIKKEMPISEGKSEVCNNIVDMGHIMGLDTKNRNWHRRISLGMDINTSPDKNDPRFKYIDLVTFAAYAQKEMEGIILAVEEG